MRGSFGHDGVGGSNGFRFTGRLGRNALPAGKYVLVAATRDAAGNGGKPRRTGFEIRKR